MSLDSFAEILGPLFFGFGHRAGGRRPQEKDMPSLDNLPDKTWLTPCKPSEARLTIVQITDVYTLDYFANLKTLLSTIRAAQQENLDNNTNRVISVLTGDFLSPYLLSSIDRGAGMMQALKHTPIDYLTWGNHEADIDHRTVCRHVKNFTGTWINSNMQSHEAMEYQVPYEVITVTSPDGSNIRKIGLVAVLSDDPKLYAHFKPPGAFGGATIDCPWETLRHYKQVLEEEHECDIVVPCEHLYVPENIRTCQEFDFPVILSGHDHHRVDEIINETRLIKPGMDGVYATVLEICWESNAGKQPKIHSTFVKTSDWEADPELRQLTDCAYNVLLPLRNTELAGVPSEFEPLSSKNARGSVCTMGRLVCSMLKSSLEQTREKGRVDAVILMGGNIRGNEDYPIGSFISMETLEAEIKSDEVIGVVPILGSVLAEGIEATHAGDPIPGWMQYDDGIREEVVLVEDNPETHGRPTTKVTTVAGKPIDPHRIYYVATKIKDLTNGQSPPLTEYFKSRPELLPAQGSYINIQTELMGFFARNLFRKLWEATGHRIPDPEEKVEEASHPAPSIPEMEARLRHEVLDRDDDGIVSVEDIHLCLRDFLGLSVHENEMTLAEYIHQYADVTGDGQVTLRDLEIFCTGQLPRETKPIRKWSESFPDAPVPEEAEMQQQQEAFGMKRIETTQTLMSEDSLEK